MRELRVDIQALRGLAVLLVVLYHAKLGLFPSGYLGVDIFFVISGYLITGLIRDGIQVGTFRASNFYFRRAKRLLPAAYTVFAITALAAPFFLARYELGHLRAQIIGSITFTANLVLWKQTGYFSGAAELKPLLHVWSLSIEEQYYFILPLLLIVSPRRFWLPLALAIFGASFALRIAASGHPDAAFYLFPTRAWELTLGSIGALLPPIRGAFSKALRMAFWPSLFAIVVVPAIEAGQWQPLVSLFVVCLATLLILLRRNEGFFELPGMTVLTKVGDMSYSLYLVHWPLFAFFANVWVSGSPQTALFWHVLLVFISFVTAYLLYRYIEMPIHYKPVVRRSRFVGGLIATSVLLGIIWAICCVGHSIFRFPDSELRVERRV